MQYKKIEMRTDAEYRRHIRTMTENNDAEALCRRELSPKAFKTMNSLIADAGALHKEGSEEAAERAMWIANAEILYKQYIDSHAKDFVPFKIDGAQTNTETSWPHIGIYAGGNNYDPYGLRQDAVTASTIDERNETIRAVHKRLGSPGAFYEDGTYPWLADVAGVSAVILANGCGCSFADCSGAAECRFYKKASSIIKLFCRALGRNDLFDKYSQTLAVHNGGVSEAPAAAPKRRETTIKALPDETVAKIKAHANDLHERFMTETRNIPPTFFDAYEEKRYDEEDECYYDDYDERKFIRGQINTLASLAIDYLLIAFMYGDMQPTRNELAKIRYYSPGLPANVAAVDLSDSKCILKIPATKKMGREMPPIDLTGTQLHEFLKTWQPYAQAIQEDYIREYGDKLIDSPFLVCQYDPTKCYFCEGEKTATKVPVGKTPHTGLVNRRARLFRLAKIEILPRHNGCIAARHTRTTADAKENAKLPPKERVAAQKRQAAERDHSATTAAAVYEDAPAPAPAPKKRRKKVTVVEEDESTATD